MSQSYADIWTKKSSHVTVIFHEAYGPDTKLELIPVTLFVRNNATLKMICVSPHKGIYHSTVFFVLLNNCLLFTRLFSWQEALLLLREELPVVLKAVQALQHHLNIQVGDDVGIMAIL